jgi:hypothetical protein
LNRARNCQNATQSERIRLIQRINRRVEGVGALGRLDHGTWELVGSTSDHGQLLGIQIARDADLIPIVDSGRGQITGGIVRRAQELGQQPITFHRLGKIGEPHTGKLLECSVEGNLRVRIVGRSRSRHHNVLTITNYVKGVGAFDLLLRNREIIIEVCDLRGTELAGTEVTVVGVRC